jgi:hypothetical protein
MAKCFGQEISLNHFVLALFFDVLELLCSGRVSGYWTDIVSLL